MRFVLTSESLLEPRCDREETPIRIAPAGTAFGRLPLEPASRTATAAVTLPRLRGPIRSLQPSSSTTLCCGYLFGLC